MKLIVCTTCSAIFSRSSRQSFVRFSPIIHWYIVIEEKSDKKITYVILFCKGKKLLFVVTTFFFKDDFCCTLLFYRFGGCKVNVLPISTEIVSNFRFETDFLCSSNVIGIAKNLIKNCKG